MNIRRRSTPSAVIIDRQTGERLTVKVWYDGGLWWVQHANCFACLIALDREGDFALVPNCGPRPWAAFRCRLYS